MKKIEKYYALNKQEDEDGYTLYPENAILYEKGKRKICFPNYTVNTEPSSAKLQFRSFIFPLPAKMSRMAEG